MAKKRVFIIHNIDLSIGHLIGDSIRIGRPIRHITVHFMKWTN
jgi:hypothetical protein